MEETTWFVYSWSFEDPGLIREEVFPSLEEARKRVDEIMKDPNKDAYITQHQEASELSDYYDFV